MIQLRWKKPGHQDEDTPKGVVIGWHENGNDYYVLQYREVDGVEDPHPEYPEWETVEAG